jgi:hypothetical protein
MLRPMVSMRISGTTVKSAEMIQVIVRIPTKSILVSGGMKWKPLNMLAVP